MNITAYIRELLLGHDCVIVPGFGGFIGNYSPARIDMSSGTFYPPLKQISFNRNLNHNDGLLIGRISKSAGINYGDSRNMVEEFVAELRNRLARGEKVVFDHIGSFANNHENNIQFEPDRDANYHLDSYGLESFHYLPIEGYDVRKRITRHAYRDPVRQASIRKNLLRAAVAIPLLAVLVILPLKIDIFKAKVESATMNPLVAVEFENNRKAVDKDITGDTVAPEEKPIVVPENNVSSVSVQASNEKSVLILPVEEGHYFIITGSFKSEENALSQVGMLKAEGFEPEITQASNGFYRVNAMRCSNMDSALSKRDSLSKRFPGVWISKR